MPNNKPQIIPSQVPLEGATIILRAYNESGGISNTEVATNVRGIAGVVQSTLSATESTITNERGADVVYQNSVSIGVSIIMNNISETFHNFITGKTQHDDIGDMVKMTATYSAITTKDGANPPIITLPNVPIDDSVIVFDPYDNIMEKVTTASPLTKGQFYVDVTAKTITFADDDNNISVVVVYDYETEILNHISVEPLPRVKYFEMKIISKTTSENGINYKKYDIFKKMNITGDIPEYPKTKDKAGATMTYNLSSGPLPEGQTPYESYTVADDAA